MGLPVAPSMFIVRNVDAGLLEAHAHHDDSDSGDGGDHDLTKWSSLIGIVTAIVGNVLIALALNVQRYAHTRLHRQRVKVRRRAKEALKRAQESGHRNGTYGTLDGDGDARSREEGSYTNASRANVADVADDRDAQESDPLRRRSSRSDDSVTGSDYSGEDDKATSSYLKSPYWWMGQILITLGELGNFLAYGFAPASIVSPLGVVALISNCMIAPMLFKEKFRQRDFWGVVIAVGGVVTVVLSANTEETKLDPHDVWVHITTIEFEVYMAVTVFLIVVLMWASPRYGHRTILIDLGLVGLFGGYTALSTKGVSSMLSSTLFRAFTTPVTYVLLLILLVTAVMQVRYVNKALQRFDSTQVIPIQFVTFTMCVIIGSAVLYRDFERTSPTRAAKFVGGCLLTFFGVFLITSGRPRSGDDELDGLSDVEGVEETIGLAEQEHAAAAAAAATAAGQQPPPSQSTPSGPRAASRRSSKASRMSFLPTDPKLLGKSHDSGSPFLRRPSTHPTPLARSPGDAPESEEPLLANPWDNATEQVPPPPLPPGVRTISDDSMASPSYFGPMPPEPTTPMREGQGTLACSEGSVAPRAALSLPPQVRRPSATDRSPGATPAGATPGHHFSGPLFSPSPLSSTVSAVVKDTLLRNADSSLLRRPSVRRLRTSIRASLFMSEEELRAQQATEADAERRRRASRSQDHLSGVETGGDWAVPVSVSGPVSAETDGEDEGQGLLSNEARRPRSLSDTLGEMFKTKRRKKERGREPNLEGDV